MKCKTNQESAGLAPPLPRIPFKCQLQLCPLPFTRSHINSCSAGQALAASLGRPLLWDVPSSETKCPAHILQKAPALAPATVSLRGSDSAEERSLGKVPELFIVKQKREMGKVILTSGSLLKTTFSPQAGDLAKCHLVNAIKDCVTAWLGAGD